MRAELQNSRPDYLLQRIFHVAAFKTGFSNPQPFHFFMKVADLFLFLYTEYSPNAAPHIIKAAPMI